MEDSAINTAEAPSELLSSNVDDMSVSVIYKDDVAKISLSGELSFSSRKVFRKISTEVLSKENVRSIEIAMGQVKSIGTTGIGLLYLLHDRAELANKKLVLLNCSGQVKEWINIVNANNIFNVR